MWQLVYQIDTELLDEESRARPIVEAVAHLPGFLPARYDMNRRRQWRDWDLEHAVVDLLTQRTQIVDFEDEGEEIDSPESEQTGGLGQPPGADAGAERDRQSVMVTTGTRGDAPTLIAQLREVDPEAIVDWWAQLVGGVSFRRAWLTTSELRRELGELGWSEDGPVPPAALCAWRVGRKPSELRAAVGNLEEGGPVRWTRRKGLELLWLAPEGRIEGPRHRRDLEKLAERQAG